MTTRGRRVPFPAAVLAAIAAAATDRLGIAIGVIVIGAAVVLSLIDRKSVV